MITSKFNQVDFFHIQEMSPDVHKFAVGPIFVGSQSTEPYVWECYYICVCSLSECLNHSVLSIVTTVLKGVYLFK